MKVIFLLILALFLPVLSSAEEPIIIAFDMAYRPYMYWSSEESKAVGIYPQIISEVFKRLKLDIDIKPMPWKRAVENGEKGLMGVGGLYKNEARLKIFDFSDPIFSEKNYVYVKKGKQFTFQKLDDLKGKNIGVTKGWSYGEEFDSLRNKKMFSTEESNEIAISFGKLVAGKIDCFVVDALAAERIIASEKFIGQIEMLPIPAVTTDGYLAFAKTSNKKDLLKRFNDMLIKLKKDGTTDKIIKEALK